MDNRGQSLVLFVLFMPLLLILFLTIGDIGNLMISQNKYESEIKNAIKYGLKHKDSNTVDKMKLILDYTIKEDEEVIINGDEIEVKVIKQNNVMGLNFDSELDYVGYIENEKVIIDRR